jgi:hypothetical protein
MMHLVPYGMDDRKKRRYPPAMTQIAPADASPRTGSPNPQFGLRIVLGLVLLFAARDVLALFPTVPDRARQAIIMLVAVTLPALLLYFFEIRRRR